MAWEWLQPAGTIAAAGITAGFGGWLGGRRSRREQDAQHRFERDAALTEQGREKARESIATLRYLQRHRSTVADWSGNVIPEGDLSPTQQQHERLGEAIEYFHDEAVRRQVELIYDAVAGSWVVTRFSYSDIDDPKVMIWRACEEGRAVIGRYLRGEPTQAPSAYMVELRQAYDSAYEEIERQHEEHLRVLREGETPQTG